MTKIRADFAHDVLLAVAGVSGQPHVGALWALGGWMVAESGHEPCTGVSGQGAAYNPLNTTLHQVGSTQYNSAGVQNYASYTGGVQATVDTLNDPRYAKLVKTMKTAGTTGEAQRVLWEVTGSPWGTPGHLLYTALATFVADRSTYNRIPVGS